MKSLKLCLSSKKSSVAASRVAESLWNSGRALEPQLTAILMVVYFVVSCCDLLPTLAFLHVECDASPALATLIANRQKSHYFIDH